MSLPRPPIPDALRPTEEDALAAWAARCRADREQVERCREVEDPADFYAPMAKRFAQDPRRADDPTLEVLRTIVRPDDTWLDIGAGGGRYALPIALHARAVRAIDPSPAMLETLREGMREHGITNITMTQARWPLDDDGRPAGQADVVLLAHVGYDIEGIGPFLGAAERAAGRQCIAVTGEGAMTTVASLFWEPVHGEPRVPLPALPELLTLLMARGRLPSVTLVPRTSPVFETLDDLLAMARRQLWVRPGSTKDRRLTDLVEARASQRAEGWALAWEATRIGVVAWDPRA